MLNYKLFLERLYNINLVTNEIDYDFIKSSGKINRLKHLIYQLEQTGSPLGGEKISEILLGGTNLNVLDLSYPFVDLKVTTPVEGVTLENELISVKTTRDKYTLKDSVTYVNGFKIGQLIQFAIKKMNLNLYKNKKFTRRNSIQLSSITSFYDNLIIKLFGENTAIYSFVFIHTLLFYLLLKEYLEKLSEKDIIITDRDELYTNIAVLLCTYVDEKYNTNYIDDIESKIKKSSNYIINATYNVKNLFSQRIKEAIDSEDDDFNWLNFLPEEIRNLKISYCILFFDKDDDENKKIVLNLCKTQAISFQNLFKNTIKLWTEKKNDKSIPMHMKALSKKQNLYLNYDGVIKAFEGNNLTGNDVFNTRIKIEFTSEWTSQYQERPEELKKLYVKVIDKVKSIPNDEKEKKILTLLNKFLNKVIDHPIETENFIKKFSDLF